MQIAINYYMTTIENHISVCFSAAASKTFRQKTGPTKAWFFISLPQWVVPIIDGVVGLICSFHKSLMTNEL